jgi:hypothetical protein
MVESPFAVVRLRTTRGKRSKRIESATTLIWKVLQIAEPAFRRLNAPNLLHLCMPVWRTWREFGSEPSPRRRLPPDSIYTPIYWHQLDPRCRESS